MLLSGDRCLLGTFAGRDETQLYSTALYWNYVPQFLSYHAYHLLKLQSVVVNPHKTDTHVFMRVNRTAR